MAGAQLLRARCSCNGVSFAPVTLENGFLLTPNATLAELLEQARRVVWEQRAEDMLRLARVFDLLNGNDSVGRCH
jgi:hypothetical protein